MKEHITIDLPENHAVDVLAREIAKLKEQIDQMHYNMADGWDETDQAKLEEVQGKVHDCQNAIKYIYSEIM